MYRVLIIALCSLASAAEVGAERLYGDATLSQWRARLADFDAASPRAAEAVPALIEILTDGQVDAVTRRAAALALGRIGRPAHGALPTLIEMLESSQQEEESAWAAKAVSLLGPHGRQATPALAAAVNDPRRSLSVRQLSLEALARIGGAHPEAVPAILSVVQLSPEPDGPDPQQAELRLLAVEALGVVGRDAAVAAPLLARVLRSPRESEAMRRRSAESLAAMGPAAQFAREALTETVVIDDSEAVRDAAARALGALGEPARAALEQLLEHDDAGVRWRAAEALGAMGQRAKSSTDLLSLAAANEREAEIVRLHAARALWKLEANADRVWPAAIALLASEDRNLRMQSLELLVSLGPPPEPATAQLRELARHSRRDVQQIAEQALRKLSPQP